MTLPEIELETIVSTMESRKATADAAAITKRAIETEIKIGEQVSHLCATAYNIVIGHNINENLTIEQIDALDAEFSSIKKALQDKRPDKAKGLIAQVVGHDILKAKLMAILDY
jgi:hypothetical protein